MRVEVALFCALGQLKFAGSVSARSKWLQRLGLFELRHQVHLLVVEALWCVQILVQVLVAVARLHV